MNSVLTTDMIADVIANVTILTSCLVAGVIVVWKMI